MSGSKRRSTVHDFATLRLHPDGSRVALSQTNKKSRTSKYTTQDQRGNWIAQDAGGIGRVKLRRAAAKSREDNEKEQEDEEEEGHSVSASTSAVDKGKGRALDENEGDDDAPKDPRAKRRKLFHQDIGLHASGSTHSGLPSQSTIPARDDSPLTPRTIPNPTSDLLKCIHYFASTYYSEMGQLRDSSKDYRREKKLRRLARLERKAAEDADKSTNRNSPNEEGESELSSSDEESSDSENDSNASKATKRKRRSRSARRAELHAGVDMYKVFDGSALMAIGMLLQQHVDEQMTPRVPDGWEEAMEDAEIVSKKTRRREKVKMRITKEGFDEQFFDEEDGADDGLGHGELEILDGDAEADEDYVPGAD